jgi:hypothetical protein
VKVVAELYLYRKIIIQTEKVLSGIRSINMKDKCLLYENCRSRGCLWCDEECPSYRESLKEYLADNIKVPWNPEDEVNINLTKMTTTIIRKGKSR